MKTLTIALGFVAAIAAAVPGLAIADAIPSVPAAERQWIPKDSLPPGAYAAVVRGDPHVGPYAFFGRFPTGFRVPRHWHTNDVAVLITSGSMRVFTESQTLQSVVGGYFLLPAGIRYVAECPQGCEFMAWGELPFDIHYTNPGDDPRIQSGKVGH